MHFQFYFKKMESSETLKFLSRRKLSGVIERLLGDSGCVYVTFSVEKNEQKVHCHFHSWNGSIIHAVSVHENIYASIDLVAQKLEAQLARRKERRQHRMRPSASKNREFGLTKPTHIRFIEENEETSLDEWDLPQRSLMH